MLSFFSIFGIQNNSLEDFKNYVSVVNCFHFSVSLGYKTTLYWFKPNESGLWIAFIFQYLWDTKQLWKQRWRFKPRCELLSFFSIFGIQNNQASEWTTRIAVVNCFHFSVSLGYKTTNRADERLAGKLWIAFIFQYLWDTKQLYENHTRHAVRCELLSFFSIFGIQNNQPKEVKQYFVSCELLSFFSIFGIQNNSVKIASKFA